MTSRRPALQAVTLPPRSSVNAGLWLDKFLPEQTEADNEQGRGAKSDHMLKVTALQPPDGYDKAYARWQQGLRDAGAWCAIVECVGRTVIGLGEKGVLEAGLRLDRTWGVPLIPGSALKGLASTTADQLLADEAWRAVGESHRHLFGTTDEQGAVVFHDAWWIAKGTIPLHLDVLTVHHADYYQNAAPPPPADWDSPIPVSFLSVSGSYLVAVEGEREWCDVAIGLLEIGLRELGIGAKTNAGYGRMRVVEGGAEVLRDLDRAQAAEKAAELVRVQQEAAALLEGPRVRDLVTRLTLGNAEYQMRQAFALLSPAGRALYGRLAIACFDTLSPAFLRDRAATPWVRLLRETALAG